MGGKVHRKLNRYGFRVQRGFFGETTNLDDNNMESKIGFMGQMSTYSAVRAMDRAILVFKGPKIGEGS